MKSKYDLEDRLVKFASEIILCLNDLPNNNAGKNLNHQLTRSATSSALNYDESQGAEIIKDQVHKLGISLKELKESRVALKIIKYIDYGDKANKSFYLKKLKNLL